VYTFNYIGYLSVMSMLPCSLINKPLVLRTRSMPNLLACRKFHQIARASRQIQHCFRLHSTVSWSADATGLPLCVSVSVSPTPPFWPFHTMTVSKTHRVLENLQALWSPRTRTRTCKLVPEDLWGQALSSRTTTLAVIKCEHAHAVPVSAP